VRHIHQPKDSSLCGQIAVAVVTGLDLDLVIRFAFWGHTGSTSTRRVVRALRMLRNSRMSQVEVLAERLERSRRTEVAIARLAYAPRDSWSRKLGGFVQRRPASGHWVVVEGGYVWDGIHGKASGIAYEWPAGAKLTSYLPVEIHP